MCAVAEFSDRAHCSTGSYTPTARLAWGVSKDTVVRSGDNDGRIRANNVANRTAHRQQQDGDVYHGHLLNRTPPDTPAVSSGRALAGFSECCSKGDASTGVGNGGGNAGDGYTMSLDVSRGLWSTLFLQCAAVAGDDWQVGNGRLAGMNRANIAFTSVAPRP
ncbi:hypothetical protein BDW22DRAFT_1347871 [Trametopsis cervina]|nr:hypothetical protein BDW22DRAFT_1347871 [Trametopsis cervina]